jgi:hypothetical protein
MRKKDREPWLKLEKIDGEMGRGIIGSDQVRGEIGNCVGSWNSEEFGGVLGIFQKKNAPISPVKKSLLRPVDHCSCKCARGELVNPTWKRPEVYYNFRLEREGNLSEIDFVLLLYCLVRLRHRSHF